MNLTKFSSTEGPLTPNAQNVCAVIVTYHPDGGIIDRITRIAPQVHSVVVVDNGSNPAAADHLRSPAMPSNVHVLWNCENLGIATALNQGVRWALDRGFNWAITFDQDSVADRNIVERLGSIYETCGLGANLGMVGTNFLNSTTGTLSMPISRFGDAFWTDVDVVISSGSLVSIPAFCAVGGFRDELFIDTVDEEYCLRLRHHGYRVIMARDPLMVHSLGTLKLHRLLWKDVGCTNHPPLRRYYQVRNRLQLAVEYWPIEPQWSRRVLKITLVEFLLILLHEENKPPKIRAALRGAWHALIGRMGKFPLSPEASTLISTRPRKAA